MARYRKEQTEGDILPVAIVPTSVGQQLPDRERASFGELTKAYFDTQSMLGSIVESGAARLAVWKQEDDPTYNPYGDIQLASTPKDEIDQFYASSKSAGETAIIQERIRKERENRAMIEAEGMTARTIGASILSQGLDMAAFWVTGGAAGAVSAETALGAAAKGAGSALVAEAGAEAVKQGTQYERTWTESAMNLAGAAFFGGAIPAATVGIRNVMARHQKQLASQIAQDASRVAGAPNPATGTEAMDIAEAAVVSGPYTIKTETGGPISFIGKYISPNGMSERMPEPVARELRSWLSTSKISGANVAGDALRPVESRILGWANEFNWFVKQSRKGYREYLKEAELGWIEKVKAGFGMQPRPTTMSEGQWDDYVGRIIQDGADEGIPSKFGYTPDPRALEAAKKGRALLDRAGRELYETGLFTKEPDINYFTHFWKAREIARSQMEFKADLIADLPKMLEREGKDVASWTDGDLNELAEDIIDTIVSKHGNLQEGFRANVGVLKGRVLKFENQDAICRKWCVQSASEVLDRYQRAVAPQIEGAKNAVWRPKITQLRSKQAELKALYDLKGETTAEIASQIDTLEREIRYGVEEYLGHESSISGDELTKESLDTAKLEIKQAFDARKYYEREVSSILEADVSAQAGWSEELIRSESRAALADISERYGKQISDLKDSVRVARAAVETASASDTVAAKEAYSSAVSRLKEAESAQLAELGLAQKGILNQRKIALAKEISETKETISDMLDNQRAFQRNTDMLKYLKKEKAAELSDAIDDLEKSFSFGPIENAANKNVAVAEARANMDSMLSAFDSDINVSRLIADTFRGAKEKLPELSALRQGISALNRQLKDVDISGKLTDPSLLAQRAESMIAAAEGSGLEATKLKDALAKLKAAKAAAAEDISAAKKSGIAGIKGAAEAEISNAKETARDALEALRADVGGIKEAMKAQLDSTVAELTQKYKDARGALRESIVRRSAAERLLRMEETIDKWRHIDAKAAADGIQGRERIEAYYRTERAKLTDDKARFALDRQKKKALYAHDGAVRMLNGGFSDLKDVSGISTWVPRAMKWNILTKMGRVSLSQFNDVATLPLRYGIGNTVRGFADRIGGLSDVAWRENTEMVGVFADALDTITSSRMLSIAEMDQSYLHKTGADMAIDWMYRRAGTFSGFNLWSENFKGFAGQLASSMVWRRATGKIDDAALPGLLESVGLDALDLDQLGKRAWLERGRSAVPDFGKWPDDDLTRKFGIAVRQLVKANTNEPTIGMKPFWTRTVYGRMATQFKGFYFGFYEHTLGFMEQKWKLGTPMQKASVAASASSFVAFGAMSHWAREKSYGREVDIKSGEFWINSVDQSGLFTLFMEPNNILETATGNKVGFRPMMGIESPSGRYRNVNKSGALLGPSGGLAEDLIQTGLYGIGAAAGQPPPADFYKRAAKLLPYNNALLFAGIYDVTDMAGEITDLYDLPDEPRKEIPEMLGGGKKKRRKGGSGL